MLSSNQKPERVVNILRNSTMTNRLLGMGRPALRAGPFFVGVVRAAVVAVVRHFLRVGCRQ